VTARLERSKSRVTATPSLTGPSMQIAVTGNGAACFGKSMDLRNRRLTVDLKVLGIIRQRLFSGGNVVPEGERQRHVKAA